MSADTQFLLDIEKACRDARKREEARPKYFIGSKGPDWFIPAGGPLPRSKPDAQSQRDNVHRRPTFRPLPIQLTRKVYEVFARIFGGLR